MTSPVSSPSPADAPIRSATTVPPAVADTLLAEILGRPAAHAALGQLCDTVGGRPAGGEQARAAEEWAHGLLTSWGLHDVRFDPFQITAWARGSLVADVVAPSTWALSAFAHGNCPAEADVTGDVLDVGHAEPADWERLGEAVRGRVALADEDASAGVRVRHRSEKLAAAAAHGAAALLIHSRDPGNIARTGVCADGPAAIPSLGISLEDGLRLKRLLAGGAVPRVHVAMRNTFAPSTTRTVLADLPGAERPDEIVLAGGHLDSWDVAQGATDNGLGSAIVLEMARALAVLHARGIRPRRTLRFALWAAEEIGLCGSHHYVDTNKAALDAHAAVMNFDMTGDPYGYWTPGHAPHPLLAALADQLAPLGMLRAFDDKAGLHSDHEPFMLEGVPVVGLRAVLPSNVGRYYHGIGDTFDKVAVAPFARAACVGAHTLWALADAPERPLPRLAPPAVRRMLERADLVEALTVAGYDGPAMRAAAAGA
ncbi:MAG: M28 family peptidase [Ardenticatenales bacterium]